MHVASLIACRLTDNIIRLIFFLFYRSCCNSFVIFKSFSLPFIPSSVVHISTKPRIRFWYAPLDGIINFVIFFMAASYHQPLPYTSQPSLSRIFFYKHKTNFFWKWQNVRCLSLAVLILKLMRGKISLKIII